MTRSETKFFFDTEFFEDGKTIELISIGIVSDAHWTRMAWLHLQNIAEPY